MRTKIKNYAVKRQEQSVDFCHHGTTVVQWPCLFYFNFQIKFFMDLLKIDLLSVSLRDVSIIRDFSLAVPAGSLHVLMGPNGSGKSTLAYALAGHPWYQVTARGLFLAGQDLLALSPDKRAKAGLFLAMQQVPELPGVNVFYFLKETYAACSGKQVAVVEFKELVVRCLALVGLDASVLDRSLHEHFSGGEKKRLELVQLLLLHPACAILDEVDSGLDVDGLGMVSRVIELFKKENPTSAVLVITHNPALAALLNPDVVHMLRRGSLIVSGGGELVQQLEAKGYDAFAHH